IETGSLMSIRENTADILIPSEEQEVKMWPMDFEEFTWALGEDMLFDTLRAMLREKHPLGQALHRKIMTLFRLYLITGGMPQAVAKYIDSTDLKQVDQVKRNILALYRNDIIKHGDRNSLKIQQIFDQIPTELSSPNKRFMLTDISSDARMREYEDALLWLMEARLVNLCYNTMEPTVGLAARLDSTMFKCYHADTGLLISQTFAEEVLSRDEIYKKLLFYKLEFNNGMVLENVVAQLLTAAGHDLYYYAEPTDRIEIDFLLTKGQLTSRHNITPIEVKSGKEYMTKSLTRYSEKYARQIGTQYIFHDGDISVDGDVMKLPVYMAGLI
ncbi:DUF4143 domain-containing protein, partial [Candidatus Saccharibacteria bacterium]|nr:DUF4143 domain-containing protein [Candidatus Saccharibacteria bacterium]